VSLAPSPSRAEFIPEGRGHESDLSDDPETLSASVVTPLPPADLDLITHSPPTMINVDEVNKITEISKILESQRILEITTPPEISKIPEPVRERIEPEASPPPRVIESLPHQRKLSEKSCRKLEAFVQSLESARGSQVLIVIKGHPDPDCIGSASALQYCYREFDIQSSILYFDEISHPENRALVKVIEMEMTHYKGDFDFSPYQYLAFVDSQDATINGYDMNELPPILTFVDHHKETGRVQAEFIDIREDFGATSSIFAEYIEYLPELALQKSLATHAYIATALMHGIRTDTDDLMLAYTPDFFAAGYLRQFIDRDLLRMVSKQSVTARTMEIITKGLNNKVIKGTFLLAGVGFVREEDRDGIAQTADFLIRHEGVETAVVFGIVNEKFVDGSLRTSSATVDPDRWLKELFGKDETGRPFGGGRRNKGGFRVPLGLLGRSPNRKALWQLGEQTIRDIIFEKIGEKDKGHESGGNKN
jgi:nanoRNase/pAp phosphatase (c-di-AMP/oligoRNAs hydrolase)